MQTPSQQVPAHMTAEPLAPANGYIPVSGQQLEPAASADAWLMQQVTLRGPPQSPFVGRPHLQEAPAGGPASAQLRGTTSSMCAVSSQVRTRGTALFSVAWMALVAAHAWRA